MSRLPLVALTVCLLVAGCGESSQDTTTNSTSVEQVAATVPKVTPTAPPTYIETGDLNAIRSHGVLRLIAPRFDGADALPREGVPVQNYQAIAEQFSNELGLDAQWHFVDGFDQLIPMLRVGEGDVIVTNLSQTQSRAMQVDFTPPINRINEVLVGPSDVNLDSLESIGGITLAVPGGTAYVESIEQYNQSNTNSLMVNVVDSQLSDADILDGIVSGQYQATVMDSNVAALMLLDYPTLKTGATLTQNRSIGWAVRKNSPQLMAALNNFLVSHFLANATLENQLRDWAAIQAHGRIRMLTLNNPASYFMWRGDLMGFDYELANHFATQNQLHLEVVIKNSIPELINALQNGEGDFIAASLTRSEAREAQGLVFSTPYLRLTEQVVGLGDNPAFDNPQQLAGKSIGVNPDTVFYNRLKTWQADGIDLTLVEQPNVLTEELFARLVEGQFDFMMADSHLVSMEQAYRDNIKVYLDLENDNHIAWGLRPDQGELTKQLNQFIGKEYRGLFYNVTFNKYFVNERKMKNLQAYRVTQGSELSPYDDIVMPVAADFGMDWRLLTAQMFQESRFNPQAKSFAGALGLMQVMPRTGKEFGYTNLQDPKTGIEAGVTYLNWLAERFPGDIDFQERIYFQLAAYNAGAGHVRDARRLARQQGLNPDRWFDNVEKAMLLLSKPEHYKKARFGYVRGTEPVNYVREIRDRYLAYLNTSA